MKKLNNRGFLLVETVIVSVFVLTIFVMVYQNSLPMIDEYNQRIRYDDIDSVYAINLFRRLLVNDEKYETFLSEVDTKKYKDVSDCEIYSGENVATCKKLKEYLNMTDENKVYLTTWNIENIDRLNTLPRGFLEYTKYIKGQDQEQLTDYRLIFSYQAKYVVYNEENPEGKTETQNRYANIGMNKNRVVVKNTIDKDVGPECKTYNDGIDTFLVGKCSKNYIWYSGKLWRMVLINNETGAIKMVTDNVMTVIPYSINGVFENSFVDQWLTQEFLPTLHNYEDYLVTDSIWNAAPSASNAPNRPATTATVTRTVGLLNTYEYYTTYDKSAGLATYETGYLGIGEMGTMTPNEYKSFWTVEANKLVSNSESKAFGVRPAVKLKSNIRIVSGSGTESDPYKLEGDSQETINGITPLSTRYSGEYIHFNDSIYRIVGVENDLTKVTALTTIAYSVFDDGYPDKTDVHYYKNSDIKNWLRDYYQGLNRSVSDMIEPQTNWYTGMVTDNYKEGICSRIDSKISTSNCERLVLKPESPAVTTADIGLPRLGELFASPRKSQSQNFWTLTPGEDARFKEARQVWRIIPFVPGSPTKARTSTGPIPVGSESAGIAPSMYLKSNVVIAKNNTGDGTYEHPYDIEINEGPAPTPTLDPFEPVIEEIIEGAKDNQCTLYNDGVDTFLAGTCNQNYVWYSGQLWRAVLRNNATGNIKLITQKTYEDTPYNTKGTTIFENSSIDEWLNQEFLSTLYNYKAYLVLDSRWNATGYKLTEFKTKRPEEITMVTRPVGLLNYYELNKTYYKSECYLQNKTSWWVLTPADDMRCINVDRGGDLVSFGNSPTSTYFGARPAINIKSDVQIASGTGTSTDPYRLVGDET